jgi:hypothetical protein
VLFVLHLQLNPRLQGSQAFNFQPLYLSAANNLVFSARYRSFTSFRMTAKTFFNSFLYPSLRSG